MPYKILFCRSYFPLLSRRLYSKKRFVDAGHCLRDFMLAPKFFRSLVGVQWLPVQGWSVCPGQLPRDQCIRMAPLLLISRARSETQGGFPRGGGMCTTITRLVLFFRILPNRFGLLSRTEYLG